MSTLTDLETRIAFQEDMIATLDNRVSEQQREIERLQIQLQHLNRKFKTLEEQAMLGDSEADDAPPPHY